MINLQTNFAGGKTHSMLAVWHLFGALDRSRDTRTEDLRALYSKIRDTLLEDLRAPHGPPETSVLPLHRPGHQLLQVLG